MSKSLPVVAAIPNFNMGQQLEKILPDLARQGYDDIFVLDDASTDGSREIVESFNKGSGAYFIAGSENRGAGPARNLIIGALGYHATIHFLDADTQLITERIPEVVPDILPREPIGFIGGLALTEDGTQNMWNFGPRLGLYRHVTEAVHKKIGRIAKNDIERAKQLRERFAGLLIDWPDPLSEPVRKQVFWAVEQNLFIDSEVFAAVGGFDESFREHEVQVLATRLYDKGLSRWFDPSIAVQHRNEQNVRDYDRLAEMTKVEFDIARREGFLQWLMPDFRLRPQL